MAKQVIDVTVRSEAPPEAVWRLLADVGTWAEWGPWASSELAEPGEGEAQGVGAVRRFRRGRTVTVERVEVFQAPRVLGYTLVSGVPLRDYHARVTLEPEGTGTRLGWRSEFDAAPVAGAVLRLAFGKFVRDVARALAGAAARPSETTS